MSVLGFERPRLSASDRALVDAAIAAGRVRVVPPGVSALPMPVWDGRELRYPTQNAIRRENDARVNAHNRGKRLRAAEKQAAVKPQGPTTRERVLDLLRQGMSGNAIAKALGLCASAARRHVVALRAEHPDLPPPASPIAGRTKAETAERRAMIEAMVAGGATVREIMAKTGVCYQQAFKLRASILRDAGGGRCQSANHHGSEQTCASTVPSMASQAYAEMQHK